jgi:predicted exporter
VSESRVRGLTLGLLALLAAWCATRLELTNSITHFLPSGGDSELVELSLELVDSPLARRMVLAIGGGPERARVAAELAERLAGHPEVSWVEARFDPEAMRALFGLYFERRIYLASEDPAVEIPAMLSESGLAQRAARLRERLALPSSPLVSRSAPQDPLGLFDAILQRVQHGRPALSSAGDGLQSRDGEYAIVLLGLRSSPFDSSAQSALLADIQAEFERLGGGLVLEQSGVNRIAVASERSVRDDVDFISVMAIGGVCTLFLLVFRSLRHLLVAILPPMAGFGAATAVALATSGTLHGITLGFGFALIGVTIDYAIHVMNHQSLAPVGTRPRDTVAQIRSSLLMSGATTTIAFVALALSEFPGLGDMGLFAAVGVPVALAVTLVSLPAFLRPEAVATPLQRGLATGFERLVGWLAQRRGAAAAVPLVLAAIAAAGVPRLHWQDDPASLMAADPALLAEDERVRALIADVDPGRFVLALGADRESALSRNDRAHARLAQAVADGQLDGMRSLHSFLWSERLQRENLAAFRSVPDLEQRIERAFSSEGFRAGVFHPFVEAVARPGAPPLRPQDLAGTPLERALDSLARIDGRWAAVTYLRGVRSGAGIRAALTGLEGVHYVDQAEIVAEVYEGYRRSTLRMTALGAALVLLVLLTRYRGRRAGWLAFLPSALVALATLGLFGVLAIPVNVVAAISLVIVLGMGVDYGIFAVDGALHPQRVGATLSSLLVSCLTTLFVFGTLALSGQPALRAIGLTTGTGILLALLLSPAVLVLATPREGP